MKVRNSLKDVAVGVKRSWAPNATGRSTFGERVKLYVYEGSSR